MAGGKGETPPRNEDERRPGLRQRLPSFPGLAGSRIKKRLDARKPALQHPWLAPPTFRQLWHHISWFHCFLYIIYIAPLLTLTLAVSLIMFPLWFLPISSLKPTLVYLGDGTSTGKAEYTPRDVVNGKKDRKALNVEWKKARNIFAPLGMGGCPRLQPGEDPSARFWPPKGEAGGKGRRGRWRGFWMRVWDMHTLQRDIIHMLTKQGLQLVGVWCGVTLLAMQATMMATELSGGQLARYTDAATSGGNTDFLNGDGKCGYVSGTGIANWASGWQPFIWYAAYHSALGVMCILLIVDEVLNAPMGLLAPTHSRAGTGYTIMFLAVSTMNTSPNWGWKRMIPIHQTLLTVIIFIGFYNVLRVVLAHFDCTSSNQFGLMNLRDHRTALRPWTEEQWQEALTWMLTKRHLTLDELDDLHTLQEISMSLKETCDNMDRRFQPAEIFHEAIGECVSRSRRLAKGTNERMDSQEFSLPEGKSAKSLVKAYHSSNKRAEAMKNAAQLAERQEELTNWDKQYEHVFTAICAFEAEEREMKKLWTSSFMTYLFGLFPLAYDRPNAEEYLLYANPGKSQYFADIYYQDRLLILSCDHPIILKLAGKYRLCYAGDVIKQYANEYNACIKDNAQSRKEIGGNKYVAHWSTGTTLFTFGQVRKDVCRWETEKEYNHRAGRCWKDSDDYEGIHMWYPPDLYTHPEGGRRKSNKVWYVLLDIRRAYAILVGLALLVVHIGLLWNNLGTGTNNWPAYRAQHVEAAKLWSANGGLPDDQCQYFRGSNLPIWIRPGEGSIQGVFSITTTYALWEFFLLNMSAAIVLVALTNSKIWGMSFPYPFTLIGPRLSSISIGCTLGFLGVATLQLSLFHDSPVLGSIAKGTGYLAVVGFFLYIPRNEPMLSEVARRPFWIFHWLSRMGIEYLEHRRTKAAERAEARLQRIHGREDKRQRRSNKKRRNAV